ncbi:flagellar motor protein MotD [Nitrosovibrio tenuis]|uniref:Chemotaxis protein MotB n=1 Tax=Nitrosovibrio tenuis TaxID=1233 RepID=A0A1H7JBF6_9PROT|nr:flagellar motor protein MotD [Nitrosovibrio tenuis]SEK70625.1 chemotaxis protein MotB [Nitrosovibrio tenuis]
MPRRRRPEEPENHERWLVSYSDFITLLLALFVVMYAISHVNEGKYRVVAGSLVTAFGNQPNRQPITIITPDSLPQMPKPVRDPLSASMDDLRGELRGELRGDPMRDYLVAKKARRVAEAQRRQQENMEVIARDVMAAFDPLLKNGRVRVSQSSVGVRVEIDASVLFAPGQAVLQEESNRVLGSVAQVLKNIDHAIQVEGHTDNIPIVTERFPSNWELSAVRASSVVRLLIGNGVDAARLTAVGYGDTRPLEPNDSEEGRKHNRRVTVMILSAPSGTSADMLSDTPPMTADTADTTDTADPASEISSI